MANELTLPSAGQLAKLGESGLGDLLQPLVKEIYLFDSHIAGTTRLPNPAVLDGLKTGDPLTLQREAKNRYDELAILVLNAAGVKLGYVPEADNAVFSRLMDAGKLLRAKVSSIEQKGKWRMIRIGIYLVDY